MSAQDTDVEKIARDKDAVEKLVSELKGFENFRLPSGGAGDNAG